MSVDQHQKRLHNSCLETPEETYGDYVDEGEGLQGGGRAHRLEDIEANGNLEEGNFPYPSKCPGVRLRRYKLYW